MWGDQDYPRYFQNYPCPTIPKYLDDFYVIKLAFHIFEIVYVLIFHINRRDLSEFVLHHFVTIMLVVFSYSMNYLPIGSVIMLAHDLPDVFLNIFRICMDTTGVFMIILSYSGMLFSWIYFRLYVFPVWVIGVI
jgi:very-long-chain ceramide synthase